MTWLCLRCAHTWREAVLIVQNARADRTYNCGCPACGWLYFREVKP